MRDIIFNEFIPAVSDYAHLMYLTSVISPTATMAESSSGSDPLIPPSPQLWTRPKSHLVMASKPSKLMIFWISLLSVIILYWTWSSTPSTSSETPVTEDGAASHRKCLNDGYLLTKKIRDCETRRLLQSAKPLQYKPQQISLTFFGVKGQMGISWVTYDGDQVAKMKQKCNCFLTATPLFFIRT